MDSYISLDLETTGLSPKHDKIIEIGAVKVISGEIVDTLSTFVNPGRELDERVRELTGISPEDLALAPSIEKVIGQVVLFSEGLPLIGHRILFDYSFVKQAAVNSGLTFERTGVDTLKISRACFPELESKRLKDMCDYYNIHLDAHRALNDAIATHELLVKLEKEFVCKYPKIFEPEKLNYQVKRESPIRPSQVEKIKELIERHNIDCPYVIEKMSRNEGSRYYDKIVAMYGK